MLLAAVAAGAAGCTSAPPPPPSHGGTVTIAESDAFTSANPQTSFGDRPTNAAIAYLTGAQFAFYDATPALVEDTSFGTMRVDRTDPLTVTYTIADGVLWSDGTPVDASDLLLAWAANSGAFTTPGFTAADYAAHVDPDTGQYRGDFPEGVVYFDGQPADGLEHVKDVPTVGKDGRSITLAYDSFDPDWRLALQVGVPAHIAGERALGASDAAAGAAAVLTAIRTHDRAALASLSRFWNTAYDFASTPQDTGLLVSTGPFVVSSLDPASGVVLTRNPRYTGSHRPAFDRVVVRTISDPSEAARALASGEVDVVDPQASAEVAHELAGVPGAHVVHGYASTYEHIDLQFADGKSGVFDDPAVRRAFLETVPREQIVDALVRPADPKAQPRSSWVLPPGAKGYAGIVRSHGSSAYAKPDIAGARQLLAKAGIAHPQACILFDASNPRRVTEFPLIQRSAAQAGFSVTDCSAADVVPLLGTAGAYDAALFSWDVPNLSTTAVSAIFASAGGIDNYNRYASPTVDADLARLGAEDDPARRGAILESIDSALFADAYGLPLYQLPAIAGVSDRVAGVSRSVLPPGILWDFWRWQPAAASPSPTG